MRPDDNPKFSGQTETIRVLVENGGGRLLHDGQLDILSERVRRHQVRVHKVRTRFLRHRRSAAPGQAAIGGLAISTTAGRICDIDSDSASCPLMLGKATVQK